MNPRPDMKNVDIIELSIFRVGTLPLLHMTFTCEENNNNITKEIFDQLKKYQVTTGAKSRWLDMHELLLMSYNEKENKIEFMEKKPLSHDNNESVSSALTLLPSLLLREWHIINTEEKELLSKFIELHDLVEGSQNNNTPSGYKI